MLNTSTGSLGPLGLQFFENIQPAAVRHRDIQYNYIPHFGPDFVQDLLAVGRLAGDHHLGRVPKDLFQPLSHNRMVVAIRTLIMGPPAPS